MKLNKRLKGATLYDCIIVGGGPAGLTAAIYLARAKIKTLVLSQKIGGQIFDAPKVENFPGHIQISGADLIEKIKSQLENLKVEIKENVEVEKIEKADIGFEVRSKNEKYSSKTVIIASGKKPRKLKVPGEEEFEGKGISHCVTCDGPLFQEKEVAIIGGGNSAIAAALEMTKYAKKVYILNLGANLVGEQIKIEEVKESPKIEIIPQAQVTAILGNNLVTSLKYKDLAGNTEKELQIQGIFPEIGWEPSTKNYEGFLDLNPLKEIKINENNETSVEGIFACGDVTEVKEKQVIIACGEGAKAALAVGDRAANHI